MDDPDRSTSPNFFDQNLATHERTLVCSVPKSGTYLLGAILEHLGVRDTKLHIGKDSSTFNCRGTHEEYRNRPELFKIKLPIEYSLPKILPSQFAVSHLPCDKKVRQACRDLKIIFMHRDLRDCTVSLMRFIADTGRDDSAYSPWMQAPDGPERMARFIDSYQWYFREWVKPVLAWNERPESLTVQYESLMGDFGEASQIQTVYSLCDHIGVDKSGIDPREVLAAVLNRSTITWSGSRTQRDLYWSPEVEELFCRFGGQDMNRRLGYESVNVHKIGWPRLSARNLFQVKTR